MELLCNDLLRMHSKQTQNDFGLKKCHGNKGVNIHYNDSFRQTIVTNIQGVPLAIEPGISLILLTPMTILQRNLNRGTFVVWEMKRNVSVSVVRCHISYTMR
jgi:hypothetical protein